MFARPMVKTGQEAPASPGQPSLSQLIPAANATAAGTTLTANEILSGWLQRSNGGGAGYTDVFPSVDSLITALAAGGCAPGVGDCFRFIFQNTVAFLMTYSAGAGLVAGTGTLNVAASTTRIYFITFLSPKNTVTIPGVTTTTGNKFLTNISAAAMANVMPGMAVTGTGIGASALVVGTAPDAGTITVDVNSTATADNIAVTFAPRARIDSIGVLAA
jgi:hypothetical protein